MISLAGSMLPALACLFCTPGVAAASEPVAAIDASLWWENGALFLTSSNEGPETSETADRVAHAGRALVCLAPRPDPTHATAYHVLSPQALQFLFPTDNKHDPEWGFEVTCSKRS